MADSKDPEQTQQDEAPDQNLHWLHEVQEFL